MQTSRHLLERLKSSMFPVQRKTSFQRVAEMNTAFGNHVGDANNIDWDKLTNQCKNILDEYQNELVGYLATRNLTGVRDTLGDIQVFAMGGQHIAGVDGDADMNDIVDGVMTRFVKDEADLAATIAKHAAKGVTQVYTEGEYPKMILKSLVDQPDAPKGKFLKSASYQDTVFRDPPLRVVDMATDPIVGNRLLQHTITPDPVEFGNVLALAG